MPTLHVIDRRGREHTIAVAEGRSLMQALRTEGPFDVAAICGGCLCCATCHVQIDPRWIDRLSPPSVDEQDLLGVLDHGHACSRLSCQITIDESLDGLRLTIAPEE